MTKPYDIPQDVWDKAERAFYDSAPNALGAVEAVARAILAATAAEREACAQIADEYIWDEHALAQATPIGFAVHHQSVEIAEAIRNRGDAPRLKASKGE